MKKINPISLWNDFHTRQRILAVVATIAVIVALFYWTDSILSGMRKKSAASAAATSERITSVKAVLVEINDKKANSRVLTTGLLSYVQGLGDRMGGGTSRFMNLKLVSSQGRQEQVSFRTENLVYQDLVTILKDLEQYDNVWIKTFSLSKRFDNPMRIDVMWDVIRGLP